MKTVVRIIKNTFIIIMGVALGKTFIGGMIVCAVVASILSVVEDRLRNRAG